MTPRRLCLDALDYKPRFMSVNIFSKTFSEKFTFPLTNQLYSITIYAMSKGVQIDFDTVVSFGTPFFILKGD